MQFFLQSNMVDRGIRVAGYRYQKADVYLGAFVTDLVGWFIIVCTATTLYPLVQSGKLKVESTEQIAQALAIPLGSIGTTLFAVGLLAASLLAAAVLPLATAYTWCEAFGWEIGLQKTSKQAPLFYGIFSATLFIGAATVMLPGISPLGAMLISQNLNGMLLPVVLIFHAQAHQRQAVDEGIRQRILGQSGGVDDGDGFNCSDAGAVGDERVGDWLITKHRRSTARPERPFWCGLREFVRIWHRRKSAV